MKGAEDVSIRRHYDPVAEKRAEKKRHRMAGIILFPVIPALLALFYIGLHGRHYLLISFLILAGTFLPFLMRFENRKPAAREVVLLAVMTAFCVVANLVCSHTIPLHAGTAMVILSGIALGPESGFLIGALGRLVCNFFDGQGPWTPWQMVTWGLLGLIAGMAFYEPDLRRTPVFGKNEKHSRRGRKLFPDCLSMTVFTFISVFILYGGVMNLAALLMQNMMNPGEYPVTADAMKAVYLAGIPYDLGHAAGAAFCIFLFGESLLQKVKRVQIKYGTKGK